MGRGDQARSLTRQKEKRRGLPRIPGWFRLRWAWLRRAKRPDGAFTPPQEIAELAIGLLAGCGWVSVDNGVASLTELGKQIPVGMVGH